MTGERRVIGLDEYGQLVYEDDGVRASAGGPTGPTQRYRQGPQEPLTLLLQFGAAVVAALATLWSLSVYVSYLGG